MRTLAILQAESSCALSSRRPSVHAHRLAPRSMALISVALTALLAGPILAAQSTPTPPPAPAPAAAPSPANKPDTTPRRSGHSRSAAKAATKPDPAPAPAAPPPPDWPANDHPADASVVWDSKGLLVVASNSSLGQILKDVSLYTGVKVEGMGKDERVFGTYGPGPARDVLTQLLDGSGYDVLMIGDQGEGTPREVVLTIRSDGAPHAGNTSSASSNEEDAGTEEQAQEPPEPGTVPPDQRQLPPNGAGPAVPVRTPQQIIEEMQERQRQLQQQQNPQN